MNLENSYQQNVLVTGATGFVGRPLCEKLLLKAFSVRRSVRNAEALSKLPAGVQAAPIESIGPDTDWSAALTGIDAVIHLAARVHVMDETSGDPFAVYRQVNVAGIRFGKKQYRDRGLLVNFRQSEGVSGGISGGISGGPAFSPADDRIEMSGVYIVCGEW